MEIDFSKNELDYLEKLLRKEVNNSDCSSDSIAFLILEKIKLAKKFKKEKNTNYCWRDQLFKK